MSEIIIAIAYKEDHVDTCRGCVMDSFSSDCQILIGSVHDIIDKAANLNLGLAAADCDYDFALIIDGMVFSNGDIEVTIAEHLSVNEEIYEVNEIVAWEIRENIRQKTEELREERRKEIKKQNEIQTAQIVANKENRDRETLLELAKKYPDMIANIKGSKNEG